MKKILSIIPIIILIILTTFTKSSTKKLDKKIFDIKEDLRLLSEKYELVLLDHNFLFPLLIHRPNIVSPGLGSDYLPHLNNHYHDNCRRFFCVLWVPLIVSFFIYRNSPRWISSS